jgi:hypothetical protein
MLVTVVQPGHYVVWVTCLVKDYEDKIVSGMIKKGYTVSSVNDKGMLSNSTPDSVASIISCIVYTKKEDAKTTHVYEDLLLVLKENNVYYYSAIVSAMTDSTWCCGNMRDPSKPEPPPESSKPDPDKNLN